MKLTDIENNWEKIYDLEEAINDNIKTLMECNQDCTSCTPKDRGACLLNFRKANIFYLQKLRSYEEFFLDSVQYLCKFIQGLHQWITIGADATELEEEEPNIVDVKPGDLQSMFL